MRSFLCANFLIYSTVIIGVFFECSKADIDQGKIRRGTGTSGLFAFPRVGRSDPSLMNNIHEATDSTAFDNLAYPNTLDDYDDFPKNEFKRASLKAFPRVGRTSETEFRKFAHMLALQQALEKRTGPSATSGLWFGPRLGKRSIDVNEKQHALKGQKEEY